MVRETPAKAQPKTYINHPADVAKLLKDLASRDRECFAVILLNTRNRVLGVNIVSIGTLDSALAHPREVYKPVFLANASRIIIGHNHPSGEPDPSDEDIQITQRLKEAGDILGIQLLDHVIVAPGAYTSLQELGHL
jgi:DNA repair protein RadC